MQRLIAFEPLSLRFPDLKTNEDNPRKNAMCKLLCVFVWGDGKRMLFQIFTEAVPA